MNNNNNIMLYNYYWVDKTHIPLAPAIIHYPKYDYYYKKWTQIVTIPLYYNTIPLYYKTINTNNTNNIIQNNISSHTIKPVLSEIKIENPNKLGNTLCPTGYPNGPSYSKIIKIVKSNHNNYPFITYC